MKHVTLIPGLFLGERGEAGRLCAGGSGHGPVSPRSGAGPPPRPVPVPAAEGSQSAADLNPARPVILPAAPTPQHCIRLAAGLPLQGQTGQSQAMTRRRRPSRRPSGRWFEPSLTSTFYICRTRFVFFFMRVMKCEDLLFNSL